MSCLSDRVYHVTAWANVIDCLFDRPHTCDELAEQSGMAPNTVRKLIRILHRRRRHIFIAAWRPDAIGRFVKPAFKFGSYQDVPRPLPRTPTQRSALRAKRYIEANADFTKEPSMKLHEVTYAIEDAKYREYASSSAGAAKIRVRVKKLGVLIGTEEVEVETTRNALVDFLNTKMAHESHKA